MQMSDWMKVMLEEVERKQAEEAEAREELERRRAAAQAEPAGSPAAGVEAGRTSRS